MNTEAQAPARFKFPRGLSLITLLLAVLLFFLASWLDTARSGLKAGVVGLVGFMLLRVLIELVAEGVGEIGFQGLAARYTWFRPAMIVVVLVGIVILGLWGSGSL